MFGAGVDAVLTFFPDNLSGYSDFRIDGLSDLSMDRIIPAFWAATSSSGCFCGCHGTSSFRGAEGLTDRSVQQLSGGQRQKVCLAMALAQGTQTILMDESTTWLYYYD